MGLNVTVACPDDPRYSPSPALLKKLKAKVNVVHDVADGINGADVIYTDVAVSAGMEADKEERIRAFKPFQVNTELVRKAKRDAIVMHCLPAHLGYEITRDVMYSAQSVVFDQAENRMHAQKAVMALTMR